jgi:hypothetical protein
VRKIGVAKWEQLSQGEHMTNAENIAAYHTALNAGNAAEVIRLANVIDWVASAPAPVVKRNLVNFDTGSPLASHHETILLKRGEDYLFA